MRLLGSSGASGADSTSLGAEVALLSAVALAIERRSQEQGHAIELQVDANGGWSLEQARRMLEPLQSRAVVLLEQPLAPDADAERDRQGFADLHPHCPMPLVADESCWDLKDLLRLAPVVDGVNLKLLKTGGLAPAVVMARVAAALGLDLMVGCYSDSSLLNGAAAQLLSYGSHTTSLPELVSIVGIALPPKSLCVVRTPVSTT